MVDALKYRSEPRYNLVADELRERIRSGQLKPGDRLPSFPAMRAQGVSQPTLDRVHRILEQEGLIVREPKRGVFVREPQLARATGLLGVMSHSVVRRNPYYAHLLAGVQEEAHRRKAEVLLLLEDAQPRWEELDGCIILAPNDFKKVVVPVGIPSVTLMYTTEGMASVTVDDNAGIGDSVWHLLELGHRRIGYLTSGFNPSLDSVSRLRLAAYREALEQAGILVDARWMRRLDNFGQYMNFVDLGRMNMELWLKDNWRDLGCTALLAQNDETAIGVIQALEDAGIKVPGEVSVVGFDGIEMGLCVRPSLTTVEVPLPRVGATAAAMIMDPEQQAGSVVLPVNFIPRASTAAPGNQ